MNINKEYLKKAGIIAAFILGFWVLAMWYFSPALDGKMLPQGDMRQVRMMVQNAQEVKAETGEFPLWSDRLFSGMPSNLITGVKDGSFLINWRPLQLFFLVDHPFDFLFLSMLSTFILLVVLRVEKTWAAAGAIAYAFMTFTLSSFEAGHITKVQAMSLLPGVVAGLLLIHRKKWLQGGIVLAVFFGCVISFFHYQIAYYVAFIIAPFAVVSLFQAVQEKELKSWFIQMSVIVVASLLAVSTAIGKIYDTMQYSKATMRGGSEVTSEIPEKGQKTVGAKGLDIDYAFSWSYGISETLTLFVPRFKGGSSDEAVPENDFGAERLPMYFGDLQFTSGPIYMGAILMYFFILGGVFAWNIKKWNLPDARWKEFWYISLFAWLTVIISILLSWGKYFPVNNWLFEVLPYYNKFRTPMMALSVAQAIVPFYAMYALYTVVTAEFKTDQTTSLIKLSGITLASVVGVIVLVGYSQKLQGPMDKQIGGEQNAQIMPMLLELRSRLVWNDIWRSVIFMAMGFGLIYGLMKKQIKTLHAGIVLMVLMAVDFMGVAGRYLKEDQWVDREEEENILPSRIDEQVMQDNKDRARVFDLRYSPFNDNHSAPFHRNIGGYHPAKLSRYQDIISFGITKAGSQLNGETIMNNPVLDMLNCKYILSSGAKGEEVIVRSTAMGHAWFTRESKYFKGAKEALNALQVEDLKQTAILEGEGTSEQYPIDSTSAITLRYYSPDSLVYQTLSNAKSLAVFSEVYYSEKNGSWEVLIDGKPATALRTNYILRGVEVPGGNHQVTWVFKATDRSAMLAVEATTSGILILGLLALVIMPVFKKEDA
jgi:hypothetical protein